MSDGSRRVVLVALLPLVTVGILAGRWLLASDVETATLRGVPVLEEERLEVIDGEWTIEKGPSTFVGYRIREEIGGLGLNTGVGRTPDVTGTMSLAADAITGVAITVDLTTLRSDDARRDRVLRDQGLETDLFPTAVFALAEPLRFDLEPTPGATVATVVSGDLTLHGVTRRERIPIAARLDAARIVVVATFEIALDDYEVDDPEFYRLLSIGDTATVELQLVFRKLS